MALIPVNCLALSLIDPLTFQHRYSVGVLMIQKDLADAQSAGGRGTPYFLVNGNPLEGAYPFGAFQQIIEAELARAG